MKPTEKARHDQQNKALPWTKTIATRYEGLVDLISVKPDLPEAGLPSLHCSLYIHQIVGWVDHHVRQRPALFKTEQRIQGDNRKLTVNPHYQYWHNYYSYI